MAKAILVKVQTKARKHFGKEYPAQDTDYTCEIIPGESVAIFKKGVLCNTFKIGDQAEYGSYNLSYFGEITSISPKAITIVAYKGNAGMEKRKMLDLNTFCWRNQDFDVKEASAKNFEEMQYL